MKHAVAAVLLLSGLSAAWTVAAGAETPAFPHAVLAKGGLKLTVYLPDAEKGFYRGMRFDASGIIARAEFDGRTVFGPFRPTHDATVHDNVAGPAEEFDMDSPPGWDEAGPGEGFIKIGVGILEKQKESRYKFNRPHKVLDPGAWRVESGKDWIAFRHTLAGPRGRAYEYTKRIALAAGAPGFTIGHALTNTGTKPLETVTYNHNFTVLDGDPVGPTYRVTFPFDLKPQKASGPVAFNGRELVMTKELERDTVWVAFEGADFPPPQHTVTIVNTRTGTGLVVRGDRPVQEWRFYAARTAACPEPFIRIRVAPGKTETWQAAYTLLAGETKP